MSLVPTRELKYYALEEEWQTLLRRVVDLPAADQLKVFHALTDYLGGDLWEETARAREIRRRHEALEAMRAAAQHLNLPDGQAPTIPEYKSAAKQTAVPLSFGAVYEAFENRWDLAASHFRGERIPETAAQRSRRKGWTGRSGEREAPLAGVRLFLKQDPRPEPTRVNYETWAKEFNEKPPPGYKHVIETGSHISGLLQVGWEDVIDIAEGKRELAEVQVQALSSALADAGPLIGHHLASWLLGRSVNGRHRHKRGYPAPVAQLGKSSCLWLRTDIEAWKAGRRDFTHEPGVLQHEYLGREELAERLQITLVTLRQRVQAELWKRTPQPAGRAGKSLYWSRAEVERWFAAEPRRLGRLSGIAGNSD